MWFRVDYRTIGGVYPNDPETDKDGGFAAWLAEPLESRNPYDLNTDDQRVWDGTFDLDGFPNRGTDFIWDGDIRFRPDRGVYHFSYYYSGRFEQLWEFPYGGPLPVITVTEMDLLKAEGLYRQGMGGVADLVNLTRVGRGGLLPTSDTDPHLFDKLAYEKRIETIATGEGIAYYDRRGWGDPIPTDQFGHGLVEGTWLHWPVPGKELERLGLPNYTFGGSGPLMISMFAAAANPYSSSGSAQTVPAADVYRLDRGLNPAARLAAARAMAEELTGGTEDIIEH